MARHCRGRCHQCLAHAAAVDDHRPRRPYSYSERGVRAGRARWRSLFPHPVSDHIAGAGDPSDRRHPVHRSRHLRRHDRGGADHPRRSRLHDRNPSILGISEGHPRWCTEPRCSDCAISISGAAGRFDPGLARSLSWRGATTMRPASRTIGFYIGLVLLCLFAIFPALWMAITAFKRNGDLYDPNNNPFLFNLPPTLNHISFLFAQTNYPIFLWNSFFIGFIVVAITLVLAVPAAYSLARLMGYWGERSSIAIFLVYLIPPTLLFIPLYEIVTLLGAANTVWSLILVYPTITVPFCTWLLLSFFRSIPREIEEAALTDGWSRVGVFFRVALPLAIP